MGWYMDFVAGGGDDGVLRSDKNRGSEEAVSERSLGPNAKRCKLYRHGCLLPIQKNIDGERIFRIAI